MIDVDLVKLLPQAFENFQKSFKLPAILPGGSHCMMNAVGWLAVLGIVFGIMPWHYILTVAVLSLGQSQW